MVMAMKNTQFQYTKYRPQQDVFGYFKQTDENGLEHTTDQKRPQLMAKAKGSQATKYNDENEIMTTLAGIVMIVAARLNRIEAVMSNNVNKN